MDKITNLGELRTWMQQNQHLPDDAEIAIDNSEEFRDFTVQTDEWEKGKFTIGLKAL